MSAQTAGILLGIFSIAFAAFIYWGGFAEQKRANADAAKASSNPNH